VPRQLVASLLLAGLLAACGSQSVTDPDPVETDADIVEREIPPLTAAEIEIYLRNSTLQHAGEARSWSVYLDPTGVMHGLSVEKEADARGRGQERARGTWEVLPEGLFCRRWQNDWAGGDLGCAQVYKRGDSDLFVSEVAGERREIRRTRRPGNPLGL
jgi:hypothetical protein